MNNREQIEQSVISASAYNGNDTEGLLKEIEDVYKKAQAFDEINEDIIINTLTTDQLQELLQIQKEFDDRIPTLNLRDSKIAYVVEFFEWFNTLETFKNWKKKPGKPLDVQLDELADILAFGLSIANQQGFDEYDRDLFFESFDEEYLIDFPYLRNQEMIYDMISEFGDDDLSSIRRLVLVFKIAEQLYSIDQLIDAYKKKMKRNHERQDGTADAGKGYV
ncbi:dUTPase family protein [Staphylococcus schweitzeri]|uniref:dUTPase family protein n=1 Tax=Staphylococcus schweitzeri TaxID=1654388 RepID=A0A077UJP9_9STAP|nr:dUTPase family protein [Staphylococcus schweitzeri]CDR62164.1 dUTPase family protein [Staphylococcus schweitzeri]